MSKKLSNKHVVLGLLVERSGYGYDLRHRINERFAFLQLSESGIYQLLERLKTEGLIEETGEQTRGGTPPRVVFAATENGRREFRDWMAGPSHLTVLREVLHAKLVLSSPDDLPRLIEQVVAQERECLAELSALQDQPIAELAEADTPWGTLTAILIDDATARRMQANIGWLQQVRTVLERRASASRAPGIRLLP